MELLIWVLATASVLAVGAFIGDHIIPAVIKSIEGEPRPKLRHDYAEKTWMKLLTSYRQ